MRSNRETPNIVIASAPWDRDEQINLYANPSTLRRLVDGNLNAKLGEYAGLVHGNCQEIASGSGELIDGGTEGLSSAIALFRGIKRPRLDIEKDEQIYVYVLNPARTYIYRREEDAPRRAEKPVKSVFVVYVELQETLKSAEKAPSDIEIKGVVHFWEWVMASGDDKSLPKDHATRYDERVW